MAKQFRFRLEKLEKLRERVRDQRQRALAEAQSYRQRVVGQIDQIEATRAAEIESLTQQMATGDLSVDRVIQTRAFEGLLKKYRGYLDRQLEQVDQVVRSRRDALVAAERDVRILEKLEEKLRARYDQAQARAELEQMDELGTTAASRSEMND